MSLSVCSHAIMSLKIHADADPWQRIAAKTKSPAEKELREALLLGPIPDDIRPGLWLKMSGAYRISKRGVLSLIHI